MSESAAAGPNVPATASSRYFNTWPATTVVVGKNFSWLPGDPDQVCFWFVVVDMTNNLNVVATAVGTNNSTVPPAIASLAGNPNLYMFVCANVQRSYNLPHGDLYTFLKKAGSGPGLDRLEQIVTQLGTGSVVFFSYVLGATLADNDGVGFEAWSLNHSAILAMQFMPMVVDGKTVYAPIQQGTQN
jgi:hypothetical protein